MEQLVFLIEYTFSVQSSLLFMYGDNSYQNGA